MEEAKSLKVKTHRFFLKKSVHNRLADAGGSLIFFPCFAESRRARVSFPGARHAMDTGNDG
jgi:hypothetical protein